jgi:hypothetical protein
VWGTARCHCGQYNFWLNIRYGGAPNRTGDVAGRMLVRERERDRQKEVLGSDSGEPTNFSRCNLHHSLTD